MTQLILRYQKFKSVIDKFEELQLQIELLIGETEEQEGD